MAQGFGYNVGLIAVQQPRPSVRRSNICARKVTYKEFTCQPNKKVGLNVSDQDYNKKLEVFNFLGKDSNWARDNILPMLKPVNKCWQPQDLLPDPSAEDFVDQICHLQEMNKELSDEYFVTLVGDMITEEALPTYVCSHKNTHIWGDEDTDWSVWTRGWSAEENRHGDLLNRYLYLSGRVDMKQVEKIIQYLIGSGMEIGIMKDPYYAIIYSAFQEKATFVSHNNTAKLASKHGDAKLAQICGIIAADERRHETAYTRIMAKVFELNPDAAMVAFADLLRKRVSMPAHLMFDGQDENLYAHFSHVAGRIGVYNLSDYIEITEHLMGVWNVEKFEGLSGEGNKAQDFICRFPKTLRRLGEKAEVEARKDPQPPVAFSWIFNRKI